jgi:hypothetical protein
MACSTPGYFLDATHGKRIADYPRFFSSDIATCLVGSDGTPFHVHVKALNKFLKPQLSDDSRAETKGVTLDFQDVDETTFTHCCEYAYTGDYSVIPAPAEENGDIDQLKERLFNRDNLTCNLFHPQLLPHFYNILQKYLDKPPMFQSSSTGVPDDHSEIYLYHARIYRHASRSDCPALCGLSLYYLTKALESLALRRDQVKYIVKLFCFVFEESEFMDNLQHILCEYMVWNLEVLMQDSDFLDFLDRTPELERMVFRRMWTWGTI